jgi:hypothetical protein
MELSKKAVQGNFADKVVEILDELIASAENTR